MFKILLVSALVAFVAADVSHLKRPTYGAQKTYSQPRPVAPTVQHHSQGQVGILKQHSDINPDGSYQFGFETENGISQEESASIQHKGPEEALKSAQGHFSYTSPEGEHVDISYVADENGYQPQGSHIPVAPPVPEAIQRAIDYVLAHPQAESGTRNQPAYGGKKPTYG